MVLPLAAPLIASAIGGIASMFGASQAAKAQTKAAEKATAAQKEMFGVAADQLSPFIQTGAGAGSNITAALQDPYFTKPISYTLADLEATPGYQFIRDQGLKSIQNGYAARGLGSSGAAMKGAADWATGRALSTWKDVLGMDLQQRNEIFNRFMAPFGTGASAAGALAGNAVQTGGNIGSNMIGAGNAQGAAWTSAGNTLGQLAGNVGGMMYMQPYMNQMYGGMPAMPTATGAPMSILPSWAS